MAIFRWFTHDIDKQLPDNIDASVLRVERGNIPTGEIQTITLEDGTITITARRKGIEIEFAELPSREDVGKLNQHFGVCHIDIDNPITNESIDLETGDSINAAIHPTAPIEEQLGILRDQLVSILKAGGFVPTTEFAELNEIAVAKIAEGQAKKGS